MQFNNTTDTAAVPTNLKDTKPNKSSDCYHEESVLNLSHQYNLFYNLC